MPISCSLKMLCDWVKSISIKRINSADNFSINLFVYKMTENSENAKFIFPELNLKPKDIQFTKM